MALWTGMRASAVDGWQIRCPAVAAFVEPSIHPLKEDGIARLTVSQPRDDIQHPKGAGVANTHLVV
ncbi:hypothetical protein KJ885_03325 [Patescibacteria group bacterium]|nr:hypothetical protein [Patescibacteria group bacterium]